MPATHIIHLRRGTDSLVSCIVTLVSFHSRLLREAHHRPIQARINVEGTGSSTRVSPRAPADQTTAFLGPGKRSPLRSPIPEGGAAEAVAAGWRVFGATGR